METNAFIDYNTRLFRWVAPIYGVFDAALAPLRGQFVDYLELPATARLLDAATGTARQALAFAERGFHVVGVDLSVDMLARARRTARSPRLQLMVGNAADLSFCAGEFSVAVMSFALHCMPENIRDAAVKELARVVEPGGTIAFLDYAKPERQPARSVLPRLVSLYETQLFQRYIHADFDEMLRRAGLYRQRERRVYGGMVRMTVCRHLPSAVAAA